LVDAAQHRAEQKSVRLRKNVLYTDSWLDEHLGFTGKEF
jgi:hypothetical protein